VKAKSTWNQLDISFLIFSKGKIRLQISARITDLFYQVLTEKDDY